MRRAVSLLVFLALVAENKGERPYEMKWSTFMSWVGDVLFTPLPIKLPLLDLLVFALLAWSATIPAPKGAVVRPVVRSIHLSLAAIVALWLWGVARGGSAHEALFQLHWFVMMLLLALALAGAMRRPEDLVAVGKAVFFAALWRATMAFIFARIIVKTQHFWPLPMYATTHSDTVLFVTGIVIALAWAAEVRTRKAIVWGLVSAAWLAIAIQLNNRRLAWVSLVAALAVYYAMLPASRLKRRLVRWAIIAAPILGIYVAVGWGRTEPIFKPLAALETVSTKEDASTETRDIENYNLVATLKTDPLLGTGWGHEYIEESHAYSIKDIFPQYRYIPHNSVLGFLAFTGFAGFAGTWLVFPVSAFFAARSYRVAKRPVARVAAIVALTEVVIYTNQMYGDMGAVSGTCAVVMAVAFATSARLPAMVGAWPDGRRVAPPAPPAEPPRTPAPPAVQSSRA